jgi:serine/threonine protein kinase
MPPQLNVLVDDDGSAKICDFGLLRLVRESAPTGMTTKSSHTGTTRYLSYELVSGEDDYDGKPTTASDVYALACIGMEVCTFLSLCDPPSPIQFSVHLPKTTACKYSRFKTQN